jgi:hypothetical protein
MVYTWLRITGAVSVLLFLFCLSNLVLVRTKNRALPKLHRPAGIAAATLSLAHIALRLFLWPFTVQDVSGLLFLLPMVVALVLTNLHKAGVVKKPTFALHRALMVASGVFLVVHAVVVALAFGLF